MFSTGSTQLGFLLVLTSILPSRAVLFQTGSLGQFSIQPWLNQNLTEPVRRKGWKEPLETSQRGVYRFRMFFPLHCPRQGEGQGRMGVLQRLQDSSFG